MLRNRFEEISFGRERLRRDVHSGFEPLCPRSGRRVGPDCRHDPEAGGEILASRLWEERRLAYPINGHRKGTYWLTYFKLDSGQLDALHRAVPDEREHPAELFLKVDPRIVDALVSSCPGRRPTRAKRRAAATPVAAAAVGGR